MEHYIAMSVRLLRHHYKMNMLLLLGMGGIPPFKNVNLLIYEYREYIF
jgi:hypothetical protein